MQHGLVLTALLWWGPAHALPIVAEEAAPARVVAGSETSAAPAALPVTDAAANGAPDKPGSTSSPPASSTRSPAVRAERLERTRGGTDTVTNTARLSGTVANNSAINVSTGSNFIEGGSFANASGLPVVIQNSGANVLIQNATIINLQLK